MTGMMALTGKLLLKPFSTDSFRASSSSPDLVSDVSNEYLVHQLRS